MLAGALLTTDQQGGPRAQRRPLKKQVLRAAALVPVHGLSGCLAPQRLLEVACQLLCPQEFSGKDTEVGYAET